MYRLDSFLFLFLLIALAKPTLQTTQDGQSERNEQELPQSFPSQIPTDFPSTIPSDLPSVTPSALPSMAPSRQIVDVLLFVEFDDSPSEISLAIREVVSRRMVFFRPYGFYMASRDNVTEIVPLTAGGDYTFIISDESGNGMMNPSGSYIIKQDNDVLVSGDGNFEAWKATNFTIQLPSTFSPAPTIPPTGTPAPATTPASVAPTQQVVDVVLFVEFDDSPMEISLAIRDVSSRRMVFFRPYGFFNESQDNVTDVFPLVAGGDYIFIIADESGNGMMNPSGSYILTQDDEVLVSGDGNFEAVRETNFTVELNQTSSSSPTTSTISFPPSDVPSMMPSDIPTVLSTSSPAPTSSEISVPPGDVPSMVPSDLPSVIPSDVPSMAPSAPTDQPTVSTIAVVGFFIDFDFDSNETSWFISDIETLEILYSSPPYPPGKDDTSGQVTLLPGTTYLFTIEDSYGDGMTNLAGSVVLFQGSAELLVVDGNFKFTASYEFTTLGNPPEPATADVVQSFDPTTIPTSTNENDIPSLAPSEVDKASESWTSVSKVDVVVFIDFDDHPEEILWTIQGGSNLDLQATSLFPYPSTQTTTSETVSLMPGETYSFAIEDLAGNGMMNPSPGSFTITQNGIELLSGDGDFEDFVSYDFTTLIANAVGV